MEKRKHSVERICPVCYRIFSVPPHYLKKGRGIYCSSKCYGKVHTGEQNAFWKGGGYRLRDRIQRLTKYKVWRQKIFIRDNFTCRKCRKAGGNLEAHHIKSFSQLIDEANRFLPLFPLYERVMNYTPLWDIDNGITLCRKCHEKTYKKKRGNR